MHKCWNEVFFKTEETIPSPEKTATSYESQAIFLSKNQLGFHMRHYFFLRWGRFFQNLENYFIPKHLCNTTVSKETRSLEYRSEKKTPCQPTMP